MPLILDDNAKQIGYVQMPSGLCPLFCKAGRYYFQGRSSWRTFRIGRHEAAQRFVAFESDTIN